ncbi:hypothetical protein PENSPDRAFT_736398 [Peniophora sp. CONT]|nr:hypothetical protein PENSPDRAFT_736398 [Peniophora sp. CONT]
MPPKRKAADDESGTAKKTKPAAPRLKKSQKPEWDLSVEKPEGEWARKSIERWSLLPPYKGHSEQSWKNYYEQRAALDEVNTPDNPASKPIVSEELGQDTWQLLRKASNNVACAIYGATLEDEERKLAIARTLRGSLYYCDLWGNDEEGGGDNPRTVNAKTRLYSPFGIGTAIDFAYDYHYRMRMTMGAERFSTLVAQVRHMDEMEPSDPRGCIAVRKDKRGLEKPEEGAVKLHNMKGATISGTAAKNLAEFEEALFDCSGWLSPRKLYDLLSAAATVGHYHEALGRDILEKAGRGKFKMFQGETDGRSEGKDEAAKLAEAEQLANDADSLPLRLLSLAKALDSSQDGQQHTSEDGALVDVEQEGTSGDAVEEPTATNLDEPF